MSDLAASAGVSVSTVSRVLNGKPGIRENTRQAVLQAMADLGYDREKLQQRTGVVGVMVPELSNPSFPAFAERLDAMFQPVHRAVIAAAGPLGANPVGDEPFRALLPRLLLGEGLAVPPVMARLVGLTTPARDHLFLMKVVEPVKQHVRSRCPPLTARLEKVFHSPDLSVQGVPFPVQPPDLFLECLVLLALHFAVQELGDTSQRHSGLAKQQDALKSCDGPGVVETQPGSGGPGRGQETDLVIVTQRPGRDASASCQFPGWPLHRMSLIP